MNATEMETLRSLEELLNEFYSTTINTRKRDIEQLLSQFSQQDNSWNDSIKFLEATQNPYVMMFCLTVIEQLINRRWETFGLGSVKTQIRKCLWQILMDSNRYPLFIQNKTAKLIIDIGRLDYPQFYPEFFNDIFSLVHSRNTTYIGLVVLQTAIEELSHAREDLIATRKEELHKLLINQVPNILNVLTAVLEQTLDKHVLSAATATPPPSPTNHHHHSQTYSPHSNNSLSNSNILSNAFELSLKRGLLHTSPCMDIEALKVSEKCLHCITQLFSWMPVQLYNQISNSLLAAVFVFATFGSSSKQDPQINDTAHLGVLAMNCVNEIISKNCILAEAHEFLYQIFLNTFHLLQCLIKESGDEHTLFANLDGEYVIKFTEFLRLFVANHFSRFESHPAFPTEDFLALLFHYTFKHSSLERLISCLDIWNYFLSFIMLKKKQRDEKTANEMIQKYKSVLVSLVKEMLIKMQFRESRLSLNELDEAELEEWNGFLLAAIEILAKVSDIIPDETFGLAYKMFEVHLGAYLELRHFIVKDSQEAQPRLQIPNSEAGLNGLCYSLRDFTSSLRVIGRLAPLFTHENFTQRYSSAKILYEKILNGLIFSNQNRFYNGQLHYVLVETLVDVHTELVASLQAFAFWLTHLNQSNEDDKQNQFITLMTKTVDSCVEIIVADSSSHYPPKVKQAAICCLLSIVNTVRPRTIAQLGSIQTLFAKIFSSIQDVPALHQISAQSSASQQHNAFAMGLSRENELLLIEVITKMLLLPSPKLVLSDVEWNSRGQDHASFIDKLLEPLYKVDQNNQVALKLLLHRYLPILTNMVNSHSESPTRSKQLLFQSISRSLATIRSLLPAYLLTELGELFLLYFLAVFDVLRGQVPLNFFQETLATLFNILQQNLQYLASSPAAFGHLLARFFTMLSLLVQNSAANLKSLIPPMLSLVLTQLSPLIMTHSEPDVISAFFDFLYQFLFNNVRYFFKRNSLPYTLQPISATEQHSETTEHEPDFLSIMQLYGESFCQTDLNLFKQNLLALENLNFRTRIYHKQVFRKSLLKQFLTLFMQCLIGKTHTILQDEIINVIYNLASVEWTEFYHEFIPQFLELCQGLDNGQKDELIRNFVKNAAQDLPSFSINLQHFANDLRYYKICNITFSGIVNC